MASKYDDMSKEEILADLRRKNAQNSSYKWRKNCTLTLSEGKTIERIILDYGCENVSQFLKKIAKGELVVTEA